MDTSKGLGRGLDALFGNQTGTTASENGTGAPHMMTTSRIVRASWQPRQRFDKATLETLAESIRRHGILEPIIVRPAKGNYEIVAGERRFQAALLAGLTAVPVNVREVDDRTAIEIALSENMEREDLSPIEVATSFSNYMTTFGVTQEELAVRIGKDRSTIANLIRLLDLPQVAKDALSARDITVGHARALLPLRSEDQIRAALGEIMTRQLSVRQTEVMVRRTLAHPAKTPVPRDAALHNIEETMQKLLATRVSIRGKVNKGVIEISYFNQEDLLRILSVLTPRQSPDDSLDQH